MSLVTFMYKPEKVHVKVKNFPRHNLQLLLSLPPHEPYSDSHDAAYNCNLLVVKNDAGYTRVYSMGMDVYNADDLQGIFSWS